MDGPRVRAFRAVCSATSLLDWRLQSKTLICGACLSRLSPVFPGRQHYLSTGKDTDRSNTNFLIYRKADALACGCWGLTSPSRT